MRILKCREDSLKLGLSFFLILGAIAGTIYCNGMNAEMKAELYTMEQSLFDSAVLSRKDFAAVFARILPKRLGLLALLFLISVAQSAPYLLFLMIGCLGFSNAILISSLTMEAGLLGICKYVLLNIPQCFLYLPVCYLLFWWMPLRGKRLTIASAIVLLCTITAGAAAESFINPWFLRFL